MVKITSYLYISVYINVGSNCEQNSLFTGYVYACQNANL